MALQTQVLARVSDSSGQARAEVDVDDTSDPLDFDLIAVRVVNGMSRPCFVDVRRGNSASFFTFQVSAGTTEERSAGGPVRTVSDIPFFLFRTV